MNATTINNQDNLYPDTVNADLHNRTACFEFSYFIGEGSFSFVYLYIDQLAG